MSSWRLLTDGATLSRVKGNPWSIIVICLLKASGEGARKRSGSIALIYGPSCAPDRALILRRTWATLAPLI